MKITIHGTNRIKLLNVPNKWLNLKKKVLNRPKYIYKYSERAFDDASKGLLVKQ